jgi:hypothetical protein
MRTHSLKSSRQNIDTSRPGIFGYHEDGFLAYTLEKIDDNESVRRSLSIQRRHTWAVWSITRIPEAKSLPTTMALYRDFFTNDLNVVCS